MQIFRVGTGRLTVATQQATPRAAMISAPEKVRSLHESINTSGHTYMYQKLTAANSSP
jgi:hypothetical protein